MSALTTQFRPILFAALIACVGAVEAEPSALCTDRPTKSTGTCTADSGHLQVESDLVSYTRSTQGDITATTWVLLNPTVKYGLSDTLDAEASAALAVESRTSGGASSDSLAGMGDLYLKLKQRFTLTDALDLALMPVIKLPTARHGLGNGAVEFGLLAPLVMRLNDDWSINLSPEIDRLRNQSGSGYHTATAQLVNLGRTLPHDFSISFEWWSAWDQDPNAPSRQASLDIGLAWLASRNVQFDLGVNRGLNAATPQIQAYLGVAKRY
jgi:hypothetical protein